MENETLMGVNPKIAMWFLGFIVSLASVVVAIIFFRIKENRVKKDEAVKRQKEVGEQRAFVISKTNENSVKIKTLEIRLTKIEQDYVEMRERCSELDANIRMQENRNNEYYNEIKDQNYKNHEVMLDKTDKVFKEILGMIRENEKETSKKFREVHERINDK